MTITLQDPTSPRDPSARHAFPEVVAEPTLTTQRTLADQLLVGPVDEEASEEEESDARGEGRHEGTLDRCSGRAGKTVSDPVIPYCQAK